jgi:TonB-linked SusC/RagA family outer membrane protein
MLNRKLRIRHLLVLLTVLCAFVKVVKAQVPGVTITGKVTEKGGNQAVPGASVVEINANDRQVNGVQTDQNGNYRIHISDPKNNLRFSYIGFKSSTQQINGRQQINISLESDASSLTEVAVIGKRADVSQTGFGGTPTRDKIGAITSIKGEVLDKQPVTSIDQMIQGRAAGVQVVSNSGDPGGGAEIRIRGAGSISAGNEPLYIIDGIPIISTPYDNTDAGRESARISPIADINPSDIERIDVLKDANAAAIYGARAANGVIIITTKRGKPGITNVTFNTQFNILEAPPAIPVLQGSEYKIMRLEAEQNNGNINPANTNNLPLVDDPTYVGYWYYQSNTDWLSLLRQTGFGQVYNLSVSGGGESMKYNFSTSYTDRTGAMVNTGNKRFTGRFNLDYKVSNKLRLSANIAFTRSKINNYAEYNGLGTVYFNALTRSSAMPNMDVDANGNPVDGYFSLPGIMGSQDNPVAFANTVSNEAFGVNLKPNISADIDIIKGLKIKSNASLEFVGENGMLYLPPEATGLIWNDRSFNRITTKDLERSQMIFDNYATYNKYFFGTKLKTNFLLGSTVNLFKRNELRADAYATSTGQLRTLGAAAGYNNLYSAPAAENIVSVFVKADGVLNDKYGFNFTVRRDGSSKFGLDNRYAVFPTVGGFWRISSEKFMKGIGVINDMKLRASWGQVGNQNITNYAYISQFSSGKGYIDYNGVAQNNPQLNHLKWETSEQSNIGLDMELFKSRLTFSAEVYNKTTRDLLFNMPLPGSSGISNPNGGGASLLTNLGSIRNRGIELDLALEAIRGKKFTWNTTFNFGINRNKVMSLPGGTLTFTDNFARFSGQVKEGDALGTYYGLVFKGVYASDADAAVRDKNGNTVYELDGTTPRIMRVESETGLPFKGGDAIYEDFNHDGIINAQDRVLIGNANASFFGGLNNTFTYKNFGFNFFIQYQYGNDVINGMRFALEGMTGAQNQGVTVLNRWRKQGDVTDMPRALRSDTRNTYGSSRWIEDGSYARLKAVTLSYRFSSELVKRFRLRGLDLFVTGTNLITITNYTGADPEISLGSNPAFIGIDRGYNPNTKQYTLGLNVRF